MNVGEEEWFGGSVVKGSQGTESANVVSTTLAREDIKEIVDHWEVDRVIAAMLVYLGESNPNGALFDAVRKHASASPRILT